MKFIVSSDTLYATLQMLGRVLSTKNTISILDSFLFEVKGTTLTLTASDSENSIISSIELASSEGDARFCAKARILLDSMREIAEQPLTFEFEPTTLSVEVTYQNGHFQFVGQSADEYPQFDKATDGMETLTLSAQTLLSGLTRCLFAISESDLRPVMNAIYFDIKPDSLTFVATDAHKLVRSIHYNVKSGQTSSLLLPQKPATLLKSIVQKSADEIVVKYNKQRALVIMENTTVICRLAEGHYPNYNAVIPTDNPYCVTINRQALLSALRRMLIYTNAGSALIKLRLQPGNLVVSGQDIDFAQQAEENVACQYEGEEIKIGFKGTFFIDLISNLGGENIILKLADPSRAGVVVPEVQEEDEDLLMMQMPMLINE